MDASSPFDALVAPLRADVRSGAADIARKASDVMARAASELAVASAGDLKNALGDVGTRVLDAQPAMAPLVALVRDVLQAVREDSALDEARRAATAAAEDFASGLHARASRLADRAAALLPRDGDVLTLSFSSSVRDTLVRAAPSRHGDVVVLESRPLDEGRTLATELARAGVPVLYAVDAAAALLASRAAVVLLGADSIGDAGVVNKVGSRAPAEAARRGGVPVLVVADETKILPPGIPQHLADDRPAADVWEAPEGVRVWNRYFEAVPLEAVTSVVTASAVLSGGELERLRARLVVPDVVRRWAANKDEDPPDPAAA